MEDTIDRTNILEYLGKLPKDLSCDHSEYFEWTERNKNDGFVKVGKLYDETPREYGYELQYWGKDAPIVFSDYPYCGCHILKCVKCGGLFFTYLELGGHGAEQRIRLVRKELIRL